MPQHPALPPSSSPPPFSSAQFPAVHHPPIHNPLFLITRTSIHNPSINPSHSHNHSLASLISSMKEKRNEEMMRINALRVLGG
jgi:hypothetical protein